MTWDEAYELFNRSLEQDGPVNVAGIEFEASKVLRELSPMDYRVMFADWADAEGIDTDELTGEDRYP